MNKEEAEQIGQNWFDQLDEGTKCVAGLQFLRHEKEVSDEMWLKLIMKFERQIRMHQTKRLLEDLKLSVDEAVEVAVGHCKLEIVQVPKEGDSGRGEQAG